jgi:hypothetical protein
VLLLSLIACREAPPPVPGDTPSVAAATDPVARTYPAVVTPSADTAPPASDSGDGDTAPPHRGTPVACPEDIDVPVSGYTTTAPVLADASAETYGAAPSPRHVHLGFSGDPASSITILWRTDAATMSSRVELGADASYGTAIEGRSFPIGTTTDDARVHEVRICGLEPGVSWHYRVGGEGGWSGDHTFTTAPSPGSTQPFVVGVAGDSRGDPATWKLVLQGMAAHGVDLRIFTGDAVDSGSSLTAWDAWFDASEGYLEDVPTVFAHSNHDALAQLWFALTAEPGNEQWYSFDYGNVHFTGYNDTVATTSDWNTELTWLATDFAASHQPWKIAFHHKPAYSSCTVHPEDPAVKAYVVPLEEAGGVDIDIAGHNHNYERTFPLRGGVRDDATGITYFVTAGSGAPLYPNDQRNSYTAAGLSTEHYAILTVQGDIVTEVAYDLAGNVIDSDVIQRR